MDALALDCSPDLGVTNKADESEFALDFGVTNEGDENEFSDKGGKEELPSNADRQLAFDSFLGLNVTFASSHGQSSSSSSSSARTDKSDRHEQVAWGSANADQAEEYQLPSSLKDNLDLIVSDPGEENASADGSEPSGLGRYRRDSSSSSGDGEPGFVFSGTDVDRPQLCSEPAMDKAANVSNVNQRVVGVIGRDVDQPNDVVKQLVNNADLHSEEWRDIFFRPIVVSHGTLARSDCSEYLIGANLHLVILCYNTTQTRIMLTSTHGGYYRRLLPFAKRYLGDRNILFALTHCQTQPTDLVDSAMAMRLRSQPLMEDFFDRQQVFSWDKGASSHQQQRFLEIVQAYQRPKEECTIL